MRSVGCRRRQHDFAVRGDVDLAHAVAVIGDRDATDFRIIFGRDDYIQRRGQSRIAADELRAVFGERDGVAVGFDAARLISRRPHGAAVDIA